MKLNKDNLITAITSTFLLVIIIVLVSYFFVAEKVLIGPILILLGILCVIFLLLFRIPLQILKSDILFGIIDNGILAVFVLSGAEFFGILGAIVGSLVGNAVTDGFAGILEGYQWQKINNKKIKDERTAFTVAVGKLAGCLFGAGIVLTFYWSIISLLV